MLGLAQPERYAFNIHDRFIPTGGACPVDENYIVVERNFDPVTYEPTSYVDGTLFDYFIVEFCTKTPPPVYISEPFPVDPTAPFPNRRCRRCGIQFTDRMILIPGRYYTGLTRDDVGAGLRYLMGTNTMNVESVDVNSLLVLTNQSNPQLLVTSNLAVFLQQALTNNAAALEALYPGLIITASTNFFTNLVTTNVTATLVHQVNAPAGTFSIQFVTNYTTNVATSFLPTLLPTWSPITIIPMASSLP